MPSDLHISQSLKPLQISRIAKPLGILPQEMDSYGPYKCKIHLSVLNRMSCAKDGNYILVTGITPTPLGEGKTTVVLGLSQAFGAHLGIPTIATLRQPSQGPTFGMKGGAAGGGYSQVIPMEDFNLHLTGDIHAVGAANNLLAAALDTRMLHESNLSNEQLFDKLCPRRGTLGKRTFARGMLGRLQKLGISHEDPDSLTPEERQAFLRLDVDPQSISWKRVLDVCDRMLRVVEVGRGLKEGRPRDTGFDISVASEVMAVMALASDLGDLRARLGRIVVGSSHTGGREVTAEDVGCAGAMAVLLKDALKPTLMQSVEGTPVLVHAGPFANIAHGASSVIADRMGLKLVGERGYVITEAGFGADIGMEKFFNVKCRSSGLKPGAVVIVATVRALKHHGRGVLQQGLCNLEHHIRSALKFRVPTIVAINRFPGDSRDDIECLKSASLGAGALAAVECSHWEEGGRGAVDLAKAVEAACTPEAASKDQTGGFTLLYPNELPLRGKIERVAKDIYGAESVTYSSLALNRLNALESAGYGHFPVCCAKTHLSLSTDPTKLGTPKSFTVDVRDVKLSAGAGFVTPVLGDIMTIPGLPVRPIYFDVDIDKDGKIEGLF